MGGVVTCRTLSDREMQGHLEKACTMAFITMYIMYHIEDSSENALSYPNNIQFSP